MGRTRIVTQFTFKVFLEVIVMDKGLELLMDHLTKEYIDDMEQATGLYARIFIELSEYYRYDSLKECYMDMTGDTAGLEDFVDYLVNANGLGYYVSHRDGKTIYLGNDDNGEKLWTVRV